MDKKVHCSSIPEETKDVADSVSSKKKQPFNKISPYIKEKKELSEVKARKLFRRIRRRYL
ncbi:HicB family protein [Sesbania bispinosa]|nr:HicB family protein [Sesbania bispinosa]